MDYAYCMFPVVLPIDDVSIVLLQLSVTRKCLSVTIEQTNAQVVCNHNTCIFWKALHSLVVVGLRWHCSGTYLGWIIKLHFNHPFTKILDRQFYEMDCLWFYIGCKACELSLLWTTMIAIGMQGLFDKWSVYKLHT